MRTCTARVINAATAGRTTTTSRSPTATGVGTRLRIRTTAVTIGGQPLTLGLRRAPATSQHRGVTFPTTGTYLFALDCDEPGSATTHGREGAVRRAGLRARHRRRLDGCDREPDELPRRRHLVAQQGRRGRRRTTSRSRARDWATARLRRRSGRRRGHGRHAAARWLAARAPAISSVTPAASGHVHVLVQAGRRGCGRADRDRPVTARR